MANIIDLLSAQLPGDGNIADKIMESLAQGGQFGPNVIIVPLGGSVQTAMDAAAAAFVSTGVEQIVEDYTGQGQSYTDAPGIKVVRNGVFTPPLGGWILSNIMRRCGTIAQSYTANSGTSLGCGSATFWPLFGAVKNLRVVYFNQTQFFDLTTPCTVKGSIIDTTDSQSVNTIPLTFGGQATVSVAPGGIAVSDPIPSIIDVTGNSVSQLEVRSYATADNGNNIPCAVGKFVPLYGYSSDLASATDYTGGATFASNELNSGFAPLCLIGEYMDHTLPKVFVLGDSITGVNTAGSSTWSCLRTMLHQALDNLGVPVCIMGIGGNSPYTQMRYPDLFNMFAGADVIISTMGRNQVGVWTGADDNTDPFKTTMRRWWQILRAQGASRIYQTTITPFTTYGSAGTDTIENQIEGTGVNASWNAAVIAANTWLKTTAVTSGYIDGCIDWAANVTAVNTSGILAWLPGMSDQTNYAAGQTLLHPGVMGVYAMAQAFDLASLGLPAKSSAFANMFDVPAGALVDMRCLETSITQSIVNNGSIGSVTNGTTDPPTLSNTPDGKPAKMITKASGKLNVTGLSFTDTQRFTFSCWICPTTAANGNNQGLYEPNTNFGGVGPIHLEGNGTSLYPLGGDCWDDNTLIPINAWSMLTITIDCIAHKISFYLNGYVNANPSMNGTTAVTDISHTTVMIGNNPTYSIDASIGQVVVYDRVLSAAEVAAMYTTTKARYGM
jgi:hypothetical protein